MRPTFIIAFTLLCLPATALAEPKPAPGSPDQNTIYEFGDDALLGGLLDANAARITVRPRAARSTLVRPRTHFVPQLLRSVEAL